MKVDKSETLDHFILTVTGAEMYAIYCALQDSEGEGLLLDPGVEVIDALVEHARKWEETVKADVILNKMSKEEGW